MKRKQILSSVAAVTLFGLSLAGPSVMAANPYGMDYADGVDLGEANVTADNDLISSLTSISSEKVTEKKFELRLDNPKAYKSGYYWRSPDEEGGEKVCTSVNYFTFGKEGLANASEYSYSYVGQKYTIHVKMNGVRIGDPTEDVAANAFEDDTLFTLMVGPNSTFMHIAQPIYKDNECKNLVEKTYTNTDAFPNYIFVDMTTDLFDNRTNEKVVLDDVYFAITDIDAQQSYKLVNNPMVKANTFARDYERLQPTSGVARNKYVADGNYIYSEKGVSISKNESTVLVKLSKKAQSDGVNAIYGFAKHAGSGILYAARMVKVTYKSDDKGKISGISQELDVIVGTTPSGSETTPNAGYELEYWTVDKDVELKDGKKIKKGEKLTTEQVEQVVVTEDLEFTAHHTTAKYTVTYKSDEHGKISGIASEKLEYGKNPAGSKVTPAEDYETKYWLADVDVTLKDGSKIKKGAKLTEAQIKSVFVDQNITFTAIHEKVEAKAPNGGMFTGEADSNTIGLIAPIATVAAIALGGIAIREVKARKAVRKF